VTQALIPDQQYQQMFSKLSTQFKTPLRNILGETQEVVQNITSNLIDQLVRTNIALKDSNEKVIHLQKLCTDNNILFMPKSPNRKERRATDRKAKKI